MKVFDNYIKLMKIAFKRDKQGIFKQQAGEPFMVPFDGISTFGDGWVMLDGASEHTLVEEDADSIQSLRMAKLAEYEEFQAKERRRENTGMDEPGE